MSIVSKLRPKEKAVSVVAYAALGFIVLTPFLLAAISLFSLYREGQLVLAVWFIGLIPGIITGASLFLLAAAKGKLVSEERLIAGVAFAGLGSIFIAESVSFVFSIFRLSLELDYTFLMLMAVEFVAGFSFLILAVINLFEDKRK